MEPNQYFGKDKLKFTINEFLDKGLINDYCKGCAKTICNGWKKVKLKINGHDSVAWECDVYTLL